LINSITTKSPQQALDILINVFYYFLYQEAFLREDVLREETYNCKRENATL